MRHIAVMAVSRARGVYVGVPVRRAEPACASHYLPLSAKLSTPSAAIRSRAAASGGTEVRGLWARPGCMEDGAEEHWSFKE